MDLKGRNFLTLKDFTKEEIVYLLDLAADFKEKKKKGITDSCEQLQKRHRIQAESLSLVSYFCQEEAWRD